MADPTVVYDTAAAILACVRPRVEAASGKLALVCVRPGPAVIDDNCDCGGQLVVVAETLQPTSSFPAVTAPATPCDAEEMATVFVVQVRRCLNDPDCPAQDRAAERQALEMHEVLAGLSCCEALEDVDWVWASTTPVYVADCVGSDTRILAALPKACPECP